MTSNVFYRKYRPQKFSEISGQESIVNTLLGQLSSGKIGHGYLFYGPRGTGKTSTARILAKAVNCQKFTGDKFGEPCNKCVSCLSITNGSSLDLIEIDAASNRGIDEIRDLREKIKLSPVSSRFKVYIIDEVHMLTTDAFNALLKTLEEPPAHAIFILCTTELSKLPQTIVSRLQRFNFSRAQINETAKILLSIAQSEGLKIDPGGVEEIARASDGSFRDAVSILDQLGSSGRKIKAEDVQRLINVSGFNQLSSFAELLILEDVKGAVLAAEEVAKNGDIPTFSKQLVLFLEKLLFIKLGIKGEPLFDYDEGQIKKMEALCGKADVFRLQELLRVMLISENEMKLYPLAQIPLVLAICKFLGRKLEEQNIIEERVGAQTEENVFEEKENNVSKIVQEGKEVPVGATINTGKPKRSSASLGEVEKNWPEFLNRVKGVNAHVVALLRSTRPLDFDGKVLTLEVFYRFHKEKLEEPKILKMLDENMEKVMNFPVGFRFLLAQRESKPTKAVEKSDVVDIKESELERIAQEIFSK